MRIMQISNPPAHLDKSSRIVWVDYYKAIGIFLIVLGHAVFNFTDLTCFLFLFHVPIFFFISGFLEKTSPCPIMVYLKKSFISLIVPYFIWNILSFVFHFPPSPKGFIAMLCGITRWNGASWFIMVLVFIKLNALFYKNKMYILGGMITALFFILQLYGKTLPYLINITFVFCPFFFAGMYGKNYINLIVRLNGGGRKSALLALFGFTLLFLLYKYTSIAHTHAVTDFIPQFYLFWISGFIGIGSMLFLCQCFNASHNKMVSLISSATLFIMCSHYEIFRYVTPYITHNYGDILTFIIVCVYFVLQCICIPIVLKHMPILAGRQKYKR